MFYWECASFLVACSRSKETNMRTVTLLILIKLSIVCLGCGPYEGPVLNSNDPQRLVPCQKPAEEDRTQISFDALIAVLDHDGWWIAAKAPDASYIDARKCRLRKIFKKRNKHPAHRSKDECLDLRFTISSSGAVTLINPPDRRFYWKIEPNVREWLDKLELDFNQVRCFNSQDLAYWKENTR